MSGTENSSEEAVLGDVLKFSDSHGGTEMASQLRVFPIGGVLLIYAGSVWISNTRYRPASTASVAPIRLTFPLSDQYNKRGRVRPRRCFMKA